MRALIVDDDYYSRSMLHEMLHPFAYCDMAVNGEEAVFAFKRATQEGRGYDLVCMDLVMPDVDGQQALKEIRALEEEMGVHPGQATKVIVTTMLDDDQETHDAFFLGGAALYLVKPIEEQKLLEGLVSLGLLSDETVAERRA
jgi:two-component system chemotaxis response regulator CheY